jgi:hypothetical protein
MKKSKTIAQQLGVTKFPFLIEDENDSTIYSESSNGYWVKRKYDSNYNDVYYENSNGKIIDNRPSKQIAQLEEIKNTMQSAVNSLNELLKR